MSKIPQLEFHPGQRWVSHTEAELGLGIIVDCDDRIVEISFPAAGERRNYAANNAPLIRVRYHTDDKVSTIDEIEFTVTEVQEDEGVLSYRGVTESGDEIDITELELTSFIHFSAPEDRLFGGQMDSPKTFNLRYQTLCQQEQVHNNPVQGLIGARVQLLPHQLYIAEQVASRFQPRVLLADEVGLGKTIEAGLIIHQQLFTGLANRVLIVLPDSLVHQWLVEMLRRFNLSFTLLDEERCEALEEDGNPFDSSQLIICQLSFLNNNANRLEQALECDWGLLVVDEAHHLQWAPGNISSEYQLVAELAAQSGGLLLLTATPEQLGLESHFARLQLLDPDRYPDFDQFKAEEDGYQEINSLVTGLLKGQTPEAELKKLLGEKQWSHYLGLNKQDAEQGQQYLIDRLLDQHGTGRVLLRNTRANVEGFPPRELIPYPLQQPENWQHQYQHSNEVLQGEQQLGLAWLKHDPRVDWLCQWIKDNRRQKTLLITHSADTALDLESHLRIRLGLNSSVFHEDMSLMERDRAAAYFSDEEDGADLLICSEIGSEGRNFQFAQHLILFDIPENPDLLEQRIGRLDRIGQKHTVKIHVPYYLETAQEVLLEWYHRGLDAFEHSCPGAHLLIEQFGQRLHDIMQDNDPLELETLVDETADARQVINKKLAAGRNHLLELNSCNKTRADYLVETISDNQREDELLSYLEKVFDSYGVDTEVHSEASLIIRPGDHMREGHFPGLPEDGISATVSREKALHREDLQLLSWEHPLVVGAMDMIVGGELGKACVCTIKLPPLKPGNLLIEAIFSISCPSPKQLQISRYLPAAPVRIVMDTNGKDFSNIIQAEHFEKLGQKVPKRTSQEIVRQAREVIQQLVSQVKLAAEPQEQMQRQKALHLAQEKMDVEIERLQSLAQVNPSIRSSEIDFLVESKQHLLHHIDAAKLELSAIRIALTT